MLPCFSFSPSYYRVAFESPYAHIPSSSHSLTRLILNSNNIRSIPHPASDQVSSAIKAISLSANKLDTWSSIDALYQWFPNLEILHILDNPFLQGYHSPFIARSRSDLRRQGNGPFSQAIHNRQDPLLENPRWYRRMSEVNLPPSIIHVLFFCRYLLGNESIPSCFIYHTSPRLKWVSRRKRVTKSILSGTHCGEVSINNSFLSDRPSYIVRPSVQNMACLKTPKHRRHLTLIA